jgi:hypothetical protein
MCDVLHQWYVHNYVFLIMARWRDTAAPWLVAEYDRLVAAELTLREMQNAYGKRARDVYEQALLGRHPTVDTQYPTDGFMNMISRVGRQHYNKDTK